MSRIATGAVLLALALGASNARAWPGCMVDHVRAVVAADTVTVYHDDASYNCCMDGVTYSVTQEPGRIEIVETEILTNICACLCCFDLAVQIRDVAPGTYTLVFRWHDDETGADESWSETIVVSGDGQGPPVVASSTNSGCHEVSVGEPLEGVAWGCVKSRYR